ncbi:MAG: adenylate/guanylate cyclase domain-containing protein [Arenicellales bacterium]
MVSDAINRKLATIFAADVVGYSKLMAADEEATLRTLQTYRKVIDGLIEKHGGRIFNTAGDAVLAEFGSAVEAVRCAISIQEDLRVRNSEHPEAGQMWFRIGINVGDVMVDAGDLFGDGVNIASRLEALAEKGGICISGSTFDQVKNKLSIAFNDIGAQMVKNIPDPVPAYRLVPGQVAVQDARAAATAGPVAGGRRWLPIAVALVLVTLVGALLWTVFPVGTPAAHPFDGYWKVTLSSLSGCFNNNTRSFGMNVRHGKIDESQQPFPKTGTISDEGAFSIRVTDRAGNLWATQTGTITGDSGEGTLRGVKPSCTGTVTLMRLAAPHE